MIHLVREEWLLNFDAEKDAYERYGRVVAELERVKPRL